MSVKRPVVYTNVCLSHYYPYVYAVSVNLSINDCSPPVTEQLARPGAK